jgi:hypothetical protein
VYRCFRLKGRRTVAGGACAALALMPAVFALWAGGCRLSGGAAPAGLAGHFEVVGPAADDAYIRCLPVTRRGVRKEAMVLVAPLAVRTPLGGCRGPVWFRSLVAPVFNVGDGFCLEVFHLQAGETRRIYSRNIDAARRHEDRQWLPVEVPVESDGSPGERLEIRISGGPRGDLVGDWLALAETGFFERAGS